MQAYVPVYCYFLCGYRRPTGAEARYLARWPQANMIDLGRSEIDLSPLVPWLGHCDSSKPRLLAKPLGRRWPSLALEVVRAEIESLEPVTPAWGQLVAVRLVEVGK
jgi:hypothetical protein